jgi:two-component system NtrC family sensor kinase
MQGRVPVRNLLIVDDEPQILNSLKRELKAEGYCIHAAESGRAGLELIGNHDIGVVLSDQMMPGMDGIAFLEEARRMKPDAIRIMLTAHGSFDSASKAINRSNVFGYLTKPWHSEDLKAFLRRAFEHYDLVMENRRLQRLTEEQNEQLRENRNMLQSVFDAMSEPLMLVDENLDVLVSNREAVDMFQDSHPLNPRRVSLREPLNNRYGTTITDSIRYSVWDSAPSRYRVEVDQADFRLEEISIHPVRERGPSPRVSALRIRDVTDEKREERRLCQQEKLAALELIMAGLLHEINNPNNFILFNLPILKDYVRLLLALVVEQGEQRPDRNYCGMNYDGFREDLLKLIMNLESGAKRIDQTLSDLQNISRERGFAKKCIMKPGEIIEKALSVCHGQIKKTVKTVDIKIEENLTPFISDPGALEQILTAVLLNAAQAADKEDSSIRLRASAGRTWRDRLVIEIEDNGCGMDRKMQERIFEPFFTTKKFGAGTGMGLYRSKTLIDDLGGTLEVESRPKEGSIFRIIVPDMRDAFGTGC